MELIGQYWWVVGVAVIAAIVIPFQVGQVRKRRVAQYKQDESLIQHFAEDLDYEERDTYRNLPSRVARMEWLGKHFPEFIAAVERHYPNTENEVVIAHYVDIRLLKGALTYDAKDTAVRLCLNTAIAQPLSDYQEIVDERNEQMRAQEEVRRKENARRAELERQRREVAAEEAKAKKEAAKAYWESLTTEQKKAFKKAKGKTARQNTLPTPTPSTPYSTDVLYAAIMATEFGKINSNHSNSIDYCESSPSSHSSYGGHDTGGYGGGYDSGSSCSSDSGGGGGGGGE